MTRKLDKEHVDAIRALQQRFTQNASQLGNIVIELKLLEQQQATLTENQNALLPEFSALREDELKLIETLKARYGDGEINIEDGTFTPSG